jgi:hypothetical protein
MVLYVSGQGGSISFGNGTSNTTICLTKWELRKQEINVNTTTTCSNGWGEVTRVIKRWSFNATAPWNANSPPDSVLDSDTPIACTFNLGASGKAYTGNALTTLIMPMVDAEDVVRVQISGEGTGPLVGPA